SLKTWISSGGRMMSAIVLSNLGVAELASGDAQQALAYLRQATTALEDAGAHGQLAETRRYLAQAYLVAGDLAVAREEAQSALALARVAEAPLDEAGAQRVLGQVALAAGNLSEAITLLETSCNLLADQGNRYELAQSFTALAEALLAQDQSLLARTLVVDAVEIFSELDASRELAHAIQLLHALNKE
ncbi:MAG TPA: tetratricopeptide repeat protein, partial [Anaerolineae bacterium]|nr:tetratricopeptide repeat protein [Anaerolineae bacterium]